jgi:hypothetical protein
VTQMRKHLIEAYRVHQPFPPWEMTFGKTGGPLFQPPLRRLFAALNRFTAKVADANATFNHFLKPIRSKAGRPTLLGRWDNRLRTWTIFPSWELNQLGIEPHRDVRL